MKKVLTTILMITLLFAAVCFVGGCGETPADPTPAPTPTPQIFPEALTNIPAIEIPDGLAETGWTISGGMMNGVEMEEDDLQSVLNAYNGTLQFVFTDENGIQMAAGDSTATGTYTKTQDNYAFHAVLSNQEEYYGVFTTVEETVVLIMANKKDPETALYFTQIEEG